MSSNDRGACIDTVCRDNFVQNAQMYQSTVSPGVHSVFIVVTAENPVSAPLSPDVPTRRRPRFSQSQKSVQKKRSGLTHVCRSGQDWMTQALSARIGAASLSDTRLAAECL